MKIRATYTCPLELVHDMIKGKWKTILIFQLRNGRCSFSNLLHSIQGITEKMLLEQLQELKAFDIIDKKTYEGYPLKVEYFLTKRGMEMLEAVQIMQKVGVDYMVEHDMSAFLDAKGICYEPKIHTKK